MQASAISKMQMRRSGDRHRIDAEVQQRIELVDGCAAHHAGDQFALRGIGIDDAGELDVGNAGQHAGMVRSHDTDADHADPYGSAAFQCNRHNQTSAPDETKMSAPVIPPNTLNQNWRHIPRNLTKHFLIQSVTAG